MAINQISADGSYREIKRIKSDSRLSEGMGRGKILQPAAMERTIESLADFKQIYSQYQDKRVIGIATAAVRQAKIKLNFCRPLKAELEFPWKCWPEAKKPITIIWALSIVWESKIVSF